MGKGIAIASGTAADFSRADLSAANLEAAKANFAWIVGAKLNNSNLQEAKFFTVNLQDADLSGAYRRFTVFEDVHTPGCVACPGE